MKEYICIDIGGTSIKHGVVREDGTFAVTGEMPTQAMEYGGPGIMEKAKKEELEEIKEENIVDCELCTVCNNDKFHSYRADKPNYGLNVGIIALK